MPSGGILASRKQFQISGKIINAFSVGIMFDGGVKRRDGLRQPVPACNGGGIGGLISKQKQPRAGL